MNKFTCECCPELMVRPIFTIITIDGSQYDFCSLKHMLQFVQLEVKKSETMTIASKPDFGNSQTQG
jgi:hypothetical protein